MLPIEKSAVDRHMLELTEALEWQTPVLLNYLLHMGVVRHGERDLVDSKVTDADKLCHLLHILKTKENGWDHLISYMKFNNQCLLADKLQNETDVKTEKSAVKASNRSALKEFSLRLAQYYQINYAHLPAMGESHTHVKHVWVPLQMDGRREVHLDADSIDHVELLSRLKSDKSHNVAIINGDPGMGKTTLAKKIAYDWAVNYGSFQEQQFSLVLAVPLRSAGRADQLDQLAIDYFMSVGNGHLVRGIDRSELVREINQLQFRLLVILDGLDEYKNFSESPLKVLFAAPFHHSAPNCNLSPPIPTFKLIIISRPYACVSVNEAFFPLRFRIPPLDVVHLSDFVNHYCITKCSAKVWQYFEANAHLIIQVPLILTLICFLADSDEAIFTNLTVLYESFLQQLIRRGNRQLEVKVDLERWKDSNLVKSTAELAYLGIAEVSQSDRFVFTKESLKKCRVTNDSFTVGFLLYEFDFAKERLVAEFPHRSIQEFFAALHCYNLILSGRKDVMSVVIKLITADKSQFGRFFMRICSDGWEFHRMANWLASTLWSRLFKRS